MLNSLRSSHTTAYAYDQNGNLVQKTAPGNNVTTYTYNYENKLMSISGPGLSLSFAYDAEGNRVSKTENTVTTHYINDPNQPLVQVLQERDSSDDTIASYTYGNDLISQTRSSATSYYLYDDLGSTWVLTDSSGDILNTYTYDAFGNPFASSGTTLNNYRFTGEQVDGDSGLYYLRARYYDPAVGRFMGRDPVGYVDGPNLYIYADNNPVNLVDPWGLLAYNEIKKIILANNFSGQSNEMIACISWKESSFNPKAQSLTSTARGLMAITKGAAKDAGYNYDQLLDPGMNIGAGSTYLKLRIKWAKGDIIKGLEGYGTGPGYATNILQCEKCLKGNSCDSQGCFNLIHP